MKGKNFVVEFRGSKQDAEYGIELDAEEAAKDFIYEWFEGEGDCSDGGPLKVINADTGESQEFNFEYASTTNVYCKVSPR